MKARAPYIAVDLCRRGNRLLAESLAGALPCSPPCEPVATPPTHWPTVWFATARALIFVIALPLAMIQLWVDLGRQNLLTFIRPGARAILKSLGQTLSRA